MTRFAAPIVSRRSPSPAGSTVATTHLAEAEAAVELFWLPLGAGGHCVRINGRVFEAISARVHSREPRDLYHSALEVRLGPARYVIEMAPVWNERAKERGAVAEGAVGSRHLGRLRLFRYEIRCWRNGHIPDKAEAVESPLLLTNDPDCARKVLELVAGVPTVVWGRDELGAGDMWNSNSLVSWLIVRSGIGIPSEHDKQLPGIQPPVGGRAPGWHAGIIVASRQHAIAMCNVDSRLPVLRGQQPEAHGDSVAVGRSKQRPLIWTPTMRPL